MGILGDISKRTVTGAVAGGALGAMSGDTNNEMLARGALGAVVGAGVGRYGGQFLGDVVADSRGLSQETKEAMQLTKSVDDLISDDLGALFNSADDIATGGQFNADQIAEGKKIYQGMSRAAKKDARQQNGVGWFGNKNGMYATLATNRGRPIVNPINGVTPVSNDMNAVVHRIKLPNTTPSNP